VAVSPAEMMADLLGSPSSGGQTLSCPAPWVCLVGMDAEMADGDPSLGSWSRGQRSVGTSRLQDSEPQCFLRWGRAEGKHPSRTHASLHTWSSRQPHSGDTLSPLTEGKTEAQRARVQDGTLQSLGSDLALYSGLLKGKGRKPASNLLEKTRARGAWLLDLKTAARPRF
jgi:hypothetical protein